MDSETVTSILKWLGLASAPVMLVLVGIILVSLYPGIELIVSRFLRSIGWLGKWVRRSSISSEIRGSINSFVRSYNSEMSDDVLRDCKIKWINDDNHEANIKPGKAIVRVSFDSSHDKNIYNVAKTYVEESFLERTKPFIDDELEKAIDYKLTREIIRSTEKSILRLWNEEFDDEGEEAKEVFHKIQEIDDEGIFKRIFIEELYSFGQSVASLVPSYEHRKEANEFFAYLYTIATRSKNENTKLQYNGNYIKASIILVAKNRTYLNFGVEAYIRRANMNARNGYETIYLLSRGDDRGDITKDIASELEDIGGYRRIVSDSDIKLKDGSIITCIPFRVNIDKITQSAWSRIESSYERDLKITGLIADVHKDSIDVDIYGKKVTIDKDRVSAHEIDDLRIFFGINEELELDISSLDRENQEVVLSNQDTPTDPARALDHTNGSLDELEAQVYGFEKDNGYTVGINCQVPGLTKDVFIPRRFSTYSKHIDISDKYSIDQSIEVSIVEFNDYHENIICKVRNLQDPWSTPIGYESGDIVEVRVCELHDSYAVCEIEEGLEGRLYDSKINRRDDGSLITSSNDLSIGDILEVRIISINTDRRTIQLSFKNETELEKLFRSRQSEVIRANIRNIYSDYALVETKDGQTCRLHISDVSWLYCQSISDFYSRGEEVDVVPINYDEENDILYVSHCLAVENSFSEVSNNISVGDYVDTRVRNVLSDRVVVSAVFDSSKEVPGFIHISEVSNLDFITQEMLDDIFIPGDIIPTCVVDISEQHSTLEMSRTRVFTNYYPTIDRDEVYTGRLTRLDNENYLVYCDYFEATLYSEDSNRTLESETTVQVTPTRLGNHPDEIEVDIAK